MPLVRISHAAGKSASQAEALSKGVHQALVESFGVPEDDYFQIISAHVPGSQIVAPERFLDIEHSDDMVFVQIT